MKIIIITKIILDDNLTLRNVWIGEESLSLNHTHTHTHLMPANKSN